jgi:hypothetical protein
LRDRRNLQPEVSDRLGEDEDDTGQSDSDVARGRDEEERLRRGNVGLSLLKERRTKAGRRAQLACTEPRGRGVRNYRGRPALEGEHVSRYQLIRREGLGKILTDRPEDSEKREFGSFGSDGSKEEATDEEECSINWRHPKRASVEDR